MNRPLFEETSSTTLSSEEGAESTATAGYDPVARVKLGRAGLLVAGALLTALLAPAGVATSHSGMRRRLGVDLGASTEVEAIDEELVEEVWRFFHQAEDEHFTDGVYSAFSQALSRFLGEHGHLGLRAISQNVFAAGSSQDVVSEALRWLGDQAGSAPVEERLRILRRALFDPSARVRDGAVLGISALDEPRALNALMSAEEVERVNEIKRLIQQVVEQLRSTANDVASEDRPTEPVA